MPASEPDQLTIATAPDFLRAAGVLPADTSVEVTELGWGISNLVLKLVWSNGCVVVKQSLPKLRVTADWPFDRDRTLVERDCLILLGQLVPGAVPDVVFCDEQRYVLVMSCVPVRGELWKAALMAGRVDTRVAARAAELLARVHLGAASVKGARDRFADQTVLIQGRTDPYHVTAATAHPELASAIEHEVERMLATRVTLTLGDYSPKNIFVFEDRVMAIDFEVAHWGDPAFDVAFCLTHLVLKALHFGSGGDEYLAAAGRFWARYRQLAPRLASEEAVVRELGCLLLARIDGKSPVEYIQREGTKDQARDLAADLISRRDCSVPAALSSVRDRLPPTPRAARALGRKDARRSVL